jgi:cytochrome c oxidase assembly factor CtaG
VVSALVTWRAEVALPLLLAAALYCVGWTRLARHTPVRNHAALVARLALALGSVTTVAVALLGLHAAAHESFAAHMVQHLLLVAVAVPALLLADPLAAVVWALPRGVRAGARRVLSERAAPRRAWQALTRMPVAWTLHAAALWLWHVPAVYDAALVSGPLHDAEHLVLTATAVLFWWPIIAPAPRHAAAPGARIVYLVLGAFQSAALGVVLMSAPHPLYAYGALEDQALGGVLMWSVGGAVDMAAVLVLVYRFLSAAERGAGVPSLTASGRQGRMDRFDR